MPDFIDWFSKYCARCGRSFTTISFATKEGFICHACKGKDKRKKRASPQHSKPVYPRNGPMFVPDKGAYSKEHHRHHHVNNDRKLRKQTNVRQRRYGRYLIDEYLCSE